MRFRMLTAAVVAATVLALTACVGTEPPTLDRPAALAALPEVELTGPGATDTGGSPVFTWRSVTGAASYSLAVADETGPVWAWQGAATEVRFGGYDREPAAGVGAQRLRTAAWWSVVALDADGTVLAVSRQRAVSPDGSVPVALGGAASSDDTTVAAWSLEAEGMCPLVSDAEAEEFLEGTLTGPGEPEIEGGGRTYYCRWQRTDDEFLYLSVSISPNQSRERWDETIADYRDWDPDFRTGTAGLGDDSYVEVDWGGTTVKVYVDGSILSVRSGFTGGAEQASIDLAALVLERWREIR